MDTVNEYLHNLNPEKIEAMQEEMCAILGKLEQPFSSGEAVDAMFADEPVELRARISMALMFLELAKYGPAILAASE